MYIEKVLNNGKDYLRLVQAYRCRNQKGFMVSRRKIILNIGPLDRYDDGKPNYLERLKESFKAGDPLIPSLKPYCSGEVKNVHNFKFEDGTDACFSEGKIAASILLENILEELGLNDVFATCKHGTEIKYDVYGIFKLLVFGRLTDPASKRAAVQQNNSYYEPVVKDFNPGNVYDTLSFTDKYKDQIIRRINTNLVRKAGRSLETIYYGITDFYCETDDSDEDIPDSDEGMKEMGMSSQTAVQMCLFMDDKGLPVSAETFPGNTPDQKTLRAALSKNIDGLDYSRFILIADRETCNYPDLLHISDDGNGYIVSESLMRSKKEERDWAYDEEGYISVGENFKYKSEIVTRTVKDQYGNDREIQEKVVVYRSRKHQEYKKNPGYCRIVTSEFNMDAAEIISKYQELTQIEDQLCEMKGTPGTQPLSVWSPEHIRAQLLICLAALIVLRIIQRNTVETGVCEKDSDTYRSNGLDADRIRNAFREWRVCHLPDDMYMFLNMDNEDVKAVLEAFKLEIPKQLYTRRGLKQLKKNMKVF